MTRNARMAMILMVGLVASAAIGSVIARRSAGKTPTGSTEISSNLGGLPMKSTPSQTQLATWFAGEAMATAEIFPTGRPPLVTDMPRFFATDSLLGSPPTSTPFGADTATPDATVDAIETELAKMFNSSATVVWDTETPTPDATLTALAVVAATRRAAPYPTLFVTPSPTP